jgi:hypothetical protein
MKTLLLIALLSAPVAVAAEETEAPRNNLIGASVVGFAGFLRLNIGSYEVFYERRFGSHAVMAVAGGNTREGSATPSSMSRASACVRGAVERGEVTPRRRKERDEATHQRGGRHREGSSLLR